jgi:hypothetical protein
MLQRSILFMISILFISTVAMAQNPSAKTAEHIRYYFVFRQLSLLNQKAVVAEGKGEDGSRYRQHYKKFAKLNDHQMSQLDQIANDCLREIAVYEARGKQLVNEARARILEGNLEQGAPLPEPPAELKKIEAERDWVIKGAYRRLIDAFGETEFRRFNERIEKSVQVNPMQISGRDGGSREISTILPEVGMVNGFTMIQEVDGEVLLYAATNLSYETAIYYTPITVGSIYQEDTGTLLAQAVADEYPYTQVILSTPALQAINYLGFGDHGLRLQIGGSSYLDPYCFRNIIPGVYLSEMTWIGCDCNCTVPILQQIIFLGSTYEALTSQGNM